MSFIFDALTSWKMTEGNVTSTEEILEWVDKRNKTLEVDIRKIPYKYDGFWFYDEEEGVTRNRNNSFFKLAGYRVEDYDGSVIEQPVILQDEIGYLGIIVKKIDGVLNFLMQAKIEPGNVNCIQISPTIQATRSNFTRKHGGAAPAFLEYFKNATSYDIIVDQIQSEQSSRFLKKRNRNIIIDIGDADIEVPDSHRWMTLGQIKKLMTYDNLVNMDTRTVLSCMPFSFDNVDEDEIPAIKELFSDKAFFESVFAQDKSELHRVFNKINDFKMYRDVKAGFVPLKSLEKWDFKDEEIVCKHDYDFKIVYCSIAIEGREVRQWEQPLVEAIGMAVFGLYTKVIDGKRKFLVKLKHEIGCFDEVELGPVVQMEPSNPMNKLDDIEKGFMDRYAKGEGVIKNVILSEEGGRFYHEQNHNVIIDLKEDLGQLPPEYMWVDYSTLNYMVQFNNVLNIQLRNLLSLLDI